MASLRVLHKLKKLGGIASCQKRHTSTSDIYDIGVIGVPFNFGQPRSGVEFAPKVLRDGGILKNLESMGYNVHDYGDLQFEKLKNDTPIWNVKNPRSVGAASKLISDKVCSIIKDGKMCLTIGGDHSLSIGSVHGHMQAEPDCCVIWVDAHADINPPLSSLSGNVHGMPLSFIVKELNEFIPKVEGFEWIKPCLNAKNIAYIGLRDVDSAERHIIEKYGITCFSMHEIDRLGINTCLERTIEAVNPGLKKPIHLSYDIDALDPAFSPSTGTPVPGGLTIREGMYIAETLAETGKLSSIDLVEVNPQLGNERDSKLTVFTAIEVIASCFGKRRMGNIPEGFELPRPS